MSDIAYSKAQEKIAAAKVKQLASINLSCMNLADLPIELFELTWLKSLDLSQNYLTQLHLRIGQLKHLTILYLDKNKLTTLPESIGQLQQLTHIGLHGNNLIALPESIGQLQQLKELDLSEHQLTVLPESIGQLEQLTWLSLRRNQLIALPESIGQLQHLKYLHLSHNNLTTLPESIGQLQLLLWFDLNYNKLATLPESIGHLQQLININLSHNQLTILPETITNLKNIWHFDINNNPLELPPIEIASKGFKEITLFFEQRRQEGVDYLHEAKLLIIGEPAAGKTSLMRKLQDAQATLPKDEETTRGIDIDQWHFQFLLLNPDQKQTRLETFQANIWDFGGQQIYHATHRFFLTRRSLYVLVADSRKENTDFYYWLNIVKLFAQGSPLLIVTNEKDGRFRIINKSQLQGQFSELKEVFDTNLKTGRGLVELNHAIQQYLTSLPHVGDQLPKTWVKVREALEHDTRNHITITEFFKLCDQYGFTKLKYKQQLSQYLHDLGICLHYQTDNLLKRIVILKPTWCTDAVYKVLDTRQVAENHGCFTDADLQIIWQEEQYALMLPELLRLMQLFRLCYEIPWQIGHYIVPQLLPETQPNYEWSASQNLHFQYHYDFMPRGLVSELIVTLHNLIWKQCVVWRTGAVFEKNETQAEVLEHYHRNRIEIRLSGQNKRDLLAIIHHEMDKIHVSYPGLVVSKLIPCNCDTCQQSLQPYFYTFDSLKRRQINNILTIQCDNSFKDVSVTRLIDDVFGTNNKQLDLKHLRQQLINMSDTDLDFLCLDHFPEIKDKFADNMTKDRKIVLVLDYCRRDNYARLQQALESQDVK